MTPSFRRPSARSLLRGTGLIRFDDEAALRCGWQRNDCIVNRCGNQRLYVRMRQPAGRIHANEACLLARSQQKLLRVGQLRTVIEVQIHTGGTCGDRYDGIDSSVRRRVGDNEGRVVVIRQLVGRRESLSYSSANRSNELLILWIKSIDEGSELGLRRRFPDIAFQSMHRRSRLRSDRTDFWNSRTKPKYQCNFRFRAIAALLDTGPSGPDVPGAAMGREPSFPAHRRQVATGERLLPAQKRTSGYWLH